MSDIKAFDLAGSPIMIGSIVLYAATGTRGTVTELMSDEMVHGHLSTKRTFIIKQKS